MQVATSVAHHKRPGSTRLRSSGQKLCSKLEVKISKRFPNFVFMLETYIHIDISEEAVVLTGPSGSDAGKTSKPSMAIYTYSINRVTQTPYSTLL